MAQRLFLIFVFSSVCGGFPAPKCLFLFYGLGLPPQVATDLAADLDAVKIDLDQAKRFIAKYGTPLTIKGSLVNGLPAKVVDTTTNPQMSGQHNEGLYFFERNGFPRVVKLLPKSTNQRLEAMEFVRALEGAALGEKFGAPRVYQFGKTNNGRNYLEMEQLFPGQPAGTFKDWMKEKGDGGLYLISKDRELKGRVIKSMAEKLVSVYAHSVLPSDLDFLLSSNGEVKWIDTHHWRRSSWTEPVYANPQRGLMGQELTGTLVMMAAKRPEETKFFIEQIVASIKASTELAGDKKRLLLEELFHAPYQTRTGVEGGDSLIQVFEKTGLFASTNTGNPLAAVYRLYGLTP